MEPMDIVIMAGGGGTRLRPISTAQRPKPFLPLLPEGETLLQRTVARLQGAELGRDVRISVVVSAGWAPLVAAQVPGVELVIEPEGRNTAAAIALAALQPGADPDGMMVVLPADHRIDPSREAAFRSVLRDAADGLATGSFGVASPLVTLGVEVTRPATEYGYLRPVVAREQRVLGLGAYPLEAFEEKPAIDRARVLQGMPGVAWNAGMFLWRRQAITDALDRFAPEVADGVRRGLASGDIATAYAALPSRSIDYAVMEPAASAGLVVMAAMDVGWTDVGTWPALLEVLGAPGIDGGVVEAGDSAATADGDLVIALGAAGFAVREAGEGTITADEPIALLRGARPYLPAVQALLDRCAAAEARS
jgi:mannose-1-phosphate guanylyltransferase